MWSQAATWVTDATLTFQTGKLKPREGKEALPRSHGRSLPHRQALCHLRQHCSSGGETQEKGTPPLAGGTLLSALCHRDSGDAGEHWSKSHRDQNTQGGAKEHSGLPSKCPSYPIPKAVLKVLLPDTKTAGPTPGKGICAPNARENVEWAGSPARGGSLPDLGKTRGLLTRRCLSTRGPWRNSSTSVHADTYLTFTAARSGVTKREEASHL